MNAILEIGLSNGLMAFVLAIVAAAAATMRKSHPVLMHTLWLLVFVKLLTPPLIAVPVPVLFEHLDSLIVRTDPGKAAEPTLIVRTDPSEFAEPSLTNENAAVPSDQSGSRVDGQEDSGDLEFDPSAGSVTAPAFASSPEEIQPLETSGLDESSVTSHSHPTAATEVSGVRGVVVAVWLAGSMVWLGLSLVSVWRVCRLLAFARPAPSELREEVRRLARRLKITRCPEVLIVSGRISPMVWPIGRGARILLPTDLLERLTREEQSTVLVHELAHVRRHDHWVRMVELVCTVLYWWHPVVWWARSQLRRAEEECCDAWVITTFPDSAQTYAAALLKAVVLFSQLPKHRPIPDPISSGVTTTRLLKRRLTMIYRQGTPLRLGRAWRVFLVLLAVLVLPIVPGRATWATASRNATAEPDASETSVQSDAAVPADESAERTNDDSPQDANEGQPFRLFDAFDGKLGLDWKPLRPDPTHVSLERNPGKLTITTQPGSIYAAELEIEHNVTAKNIYLIPNPAPGNEGFVATTCIESFHPKKPYHQAGLIVYNDDDNYLKWVMEFARYAPSFTFIHETNRSAVGDYNSVRNEPNLERFWLRLMKRGNFYQYAYSIDGDEFTVVNEIVWGGAVPRSIGILAKNARVPDEIDAVFDCFEVRSLTPEEKNEPAFRQRQKLQGIWDLVSKESDGKLLEKFPLTRLAFAPSHMTVTEAGSSRRTEYSVDLTNGWKELVLRSGIFGGSQRPGQGWGELLRRSGLFGRGGSSVRALYRLEDDTLVLAVNPQPGAPAPRELETREGDGCLLLTLKRTPADVASAIRRNVFPAKDLFLRLDANRDDHLTLKEFTSDWTTPAAVGRAKEVFDLVDRDKDDRITFDEYRKKPNKAAFLLLDVDQDDRLTLTEASSGSPVKDLSPNCAQAVFELLDKDDDGTLTLDEHSARSPEFWFVRTDRNNDDRLSLSEYSAGNSGLVRTSRVRPVFAAHDRNGDGNLSRDEFTNQPQEALFGKLDANADGKLSLQEFTNPKRTPEQVAAAKKGFAQKDSDNDDSLTFKEYAFRGEDDEFWKADKNGDNRLNRDEFEASQIWTTAGDQMAAFRSLDQNRDDNICLSEYRNRPDSDLPKAAKDP